MTVLKGLHCDVRGGVGATPFRSGELSWLNGMRLSLRESVNKLNSTSETLIGLGADFEDLSDYRGVVDVRAT